MSYAITDLQIAGYRAEPVPNQFFRQHNETCHLAIVLPGFGYTCDMPVLYFTVSHLLDLGADVLQVEYDYRHRPEYQTITPDERQHWLLADATAAWHVGTAQRPYQRITLVGKSLGTRVLPDLLAAAPASQHARAILLTPLLREAGAYEYLQQGAHPTLIAIGTADPHYDPEVLATLQATMQGTVVIAAGADHGLEVPHDIVRSVQVLEQVMRAVQSFVS